MHETGAKPAKLENLQKTKKIIKVCWHFNLTIFFFRPETFLKYLLQKTDISSKFVDIFQFDEFFKKKIQKLRKDEKIVKQCQARGFK